MKSFRFHKSFFKAMKEHTYSLLFWKGNTIVEMCCMEGNRPIIHDVVSLGERLGCNEVSFHKYGEYLFTTTLK